MKSTWEAAASFPSWDGGPSVGNKEEKIHKYGFK